MKTYIIPIKIDAIAIIEAKNRYKAVKKVASKKYKKILVCLFIKKKK